jgi:hypothetical protein
LGRFDEDAATDSARAIQDYNQNVEQANRDGKLAQKEANDKYRQKELEDERKFQEDMRKLQEDFLYGLEDALRERDARQVLRLIDKYNMDKTAMENENALRKAAASENKALEDADKKTQLDEKLRVMAEEQTLKMQRMADDSKLKRDRMEEDHKLEMARMQEQLTERLQLAADKMAEELGLNAEGAKAIFDLLSEYYGTDGALAKLTEGGYAAMLGNASGFLGALQGIVGQYQGIMAGMAGGAGAASTLGARSSYYSTSGLNNAPVSTYGLDQNKDDEYIPGYAKGGQFIATRPRKIMVGEGGQPELVQITPMSQIATGQGGSSGANGINGFSGQNGQTQISVSVDLSPDLEARVVNKSLDGMTDVISKVRRSK